MMKNFVVGSALLVFAGTNSLEAFEIGLPLDCTLGRDCFVQNFVDTDAGPNGRDYRCDARTYDGHKGMDFRIPDLAAMKRGVAVLAVADGTVLRIRDGMADRILKDRKDPAIKNRECGNGIVIDHGAGWTTQYCHLKKNSVRVRSGDRVTRGTVIGAVGLSGKTEFPHVHLTLRRNKTVIEPMTGEAAAAGCRLTGDFVFEPRIGRAIADQRTSVLNSGFSTGRVTMEAIEQGRANVQDIGRNAPALVFFARVIWLKAGDRTMIELFDPSGAPIVTGDSDPVNRDKAHWMSFAGKKRPAGGWRPGRYRASYRVLREGEAILEITRDIEMR